MFDILTGTLTSSCFGNAWAGCILNSQSVENILVSIAASGKLAPGTVITHKTITIGAVSGVVLTSATIEAITTLKSRNWNITINGVTQ